MYTAPIVVGVDETPSSLDAARYAVGEAAAQGSDIHLVHAYGTYFVSAPYSVLRLNRVHRAAETFLEEFAARLELPAAVGVERYVSNTTAVDALIRAGSEATFVVVGHRPASRGRRLLVGSTAAGLVRRAEFPVVTVPAGYSRAVRTEGGAVVVTRGAGCTSALAFAFGRVELLGGRVLVLQEPPSDDDPEAQLIDAVIAEQRARHPGVRCARKAVHELASEALRAALREGALLVVGTTHHAVHGRHRSITQALVEHSACPVAVVPQAVDVPRTGPARGSRASYADTADGRSRDV